MTQEVFHRSSLEGSIHLPPSKSQTMRALIFALMAEGVSKISNVLMSPDTLKLLEAIKLFGGDYEFKGAILHIQGVGSKLNSPKESIDCGNSGIMLRFLSGLSTLCKKGVRLTGDMSLQTKRPMAPLLAPLRKAGVEILEENHAGFAPFRLKGPLKTFVFKIDGRDSQFVSSLLVLGMFLEKPIEIEVTNPGELSWVQLTLSWLDKFGVIYERDEKYQHFTVHPLDSFQAFDYTVPSDLSSLSFPLIAAIMTHSSITIQNIDLSDQQGDKEIVVALENMGAKFNINVESKSLDVLETKKLSGIDININSMIDSICALSTLSCVAEGKTKIYGARIARTKECDRIFVMQQELSKLGAKIETFDDGLIIYGSPLRAGKVMSHGDHRVALSLATAGLSIDGGVTVSEFSCVNKTYPTFVNDLKKLNANIGKI